MFVIHVTFSVIMVKYYTQFSNSFLSNIGRFISKAMFVFLMMRQFRLYSAEKDIIKSEQFAKLLLQSTPLDEQDVKEYLQRLESRMQTQIVSECS